METHLTATLGVAPPFPGCCESDWFTTSSRLARSLLHFAGDQWRTLSDETCACASAPRDGSLEEEMRPFEMDDSDILIVDDDPDIREALQTALEIEGYDVAVAANGREAWSLLRTAPPPALILLDLMMPVMDGAEFLESLRADEQLSTLPVIVLTAFPSIAVTVISKSQGYLEKPADLAEIMRVVGRYCVAKPT